jgi:hypothetical protein
MKFYNSGGMGGLRAEERMVPGAWAIEKGYLGWCLSAASVLQ